MATEIELKLSLSPAAARTLPQHPLLAAVTPVTHSLFNTYFDTPDLDFRRQQVALRYRKRGREWLLTVKSAEPASGGLARRSEWETRGVPGQWDFGHVDDDSLRNRLERAIPQLAPIFTTHFRRTAWTFEYHGSCIEVALDRGQVASEGRQERICEVELELVRGNVADLFALASELQVTCPLFPAVASKAERGYRLFAGLPSEPFKARAPGFSPDIPPVAAFQTVALSCLEQFQRNVPGISAGTDPEYLHQARVALRRLRPALMFVGALQQLLYNCGWATAGEDPRRWPHRMRRAVGQGFVTAHVGSRSSGVAQVPHGVPRSRTPIGALVRADSDSWRSSTPAAFTCRPMLNTTR